MTLELTNRITLARDRVKRQQLAILMVKVPKVNFSKDLIKMGRKEYMVKELDILSLKLEMIYLKMIPNLLK